MKFRITFEGKMTAGEGRLDDDARKALAVAMNELGGLATNPAIDLNAQTGSITISCAMEAESPMKALLPASDGIRLALQEAAIGTPDWPEASTDDPHWTVAFYNQKTEVLAAA